MFDFRPSAELVRKYLNDVELTLNAMGVDVPLLFTEIGGGGIDMFRDRWDRNFRAVITAEAQRMRHGVYGEPQKELLLLTGGKFPPKLAERVANSLYIPPGSEGDTLVNELAEEFLQWIKRHGSTTVFRPGGPIERFSIDGDSVTLHLRPYVQKPPDPNWVQATVIR